MPLLIQNESSQVISGSPESTFLGSSN